MAVTPPNLLLLGDSLTAGFDVAHLLPELSITNHGVSGDSTVELLARLQPAWLRIPGLTHVFACIGTNDLARDRSDTYITAQVSHLLAALHQPGPGCSIHLTSVFPTRDNAPRPNPRIVGLNAQLAELATQRSVHFYNLHPHFVDETGQLRAEFTDDTLHLTAPAYQHWATLLREYLRAG